MTYPEKGAGYRHMPKFMDRALAAERRADGGDVTSNNDPIEPMPSTAEKLEHGGTYLQRMRDDEGGRGLSDWRGSFGDNEKPSRVRADNHKRGGRVRKRADGGEVMDGREDEGLMQHNSRMEKLPELATNDKIYRTDTVDTGDHMEADTSANRTDLRGLTPKRDGGRVRKRADGGNVTTPYVQGTNLASAEAPLKLLRPSPQDQQDQKMGRAYRTFGDAYSPNKRNGGRVREGD